MTEVRDNLPGLPDGWLWALLGDICDIHHGYAFKSEDFGDSGPIVLTPGNFTEQGELDFFNKRVVRLRGAYDEQWRLKNGDLLVVMTDLSQKKLILGSATILDSEEIILHNQRIGLVVPYVDEVSRFYLRYSIISPTFKKYISETASGTLISHTSPTKLLNGLVPIAPANEQCRIVAKIEALKARSQRVKEELEAIPALLDQFRQSVLAAAFRGELTADWREKNPDVEPASVLLERIRTERDKRYEQVCQKSEAEGRKKPTPFKQNIEPIEFSSLPTIPDTWLWERLVNISNLIGGVTKGRKFGNRQTIMLPYLRVANVQDGFLDLNEIKEIEVLPEDLQKYHLAYGDILFTEGGDRDKLGRGTVWWNNLENCIHQNHIYRARLYYSGVSSGYISLATKSEYAKSYFFANASQTTNLASINITTLGNLPLPIPPEKEQEEIVCRVNKFFKVAGIIEQQYQETKAHLDQLNQSILAKAFRGELVPQDPNDEPASVLLERIRAEREKLDTKKKAKGKSEKKSRKAKPEPAEPEQLNLPGFE